MKLERIKTKDGSFTYKDHDLNLSYRSLHGAKSESRHVFIEGSELPRTQQKHWRVLELGFGSGTNFSTTLETTMAMGIYLEYYSLEPHLMPIDSLLIPERLKSGLSKSTVLNQEAFSLHILESRWQDWFSSIEFDAYYHDPFGPSASPDCWTQACFEQALTHLKEDGILATYGASTGARRAMVQAGFHIAKRKGSGGKREMTIASKRPTALVDSKIIKREKYL